MHMLSVMVSSQGSESPRLCLLLALGTSTLQLMIVMRLQLTDDDVIGLAKT